jgi:RNA polymerase sigma factor (sigma-70 family)
MLPDFSNKKQEKSGSLRPAGGTTTDFQALGDAGSMASASGGPLLTFIRNLAAGGPDGQTDAESLQRFRANRDEAAFTALMQRHGPMVWGLCRTLLGNAQDAEDVFQATFLVLVRQPASVGKPASVASFLHGVAYRLAMKARAEAARRRVHERQAGVMPKDDPPDDVLWRDLRPILHQEVERLPQKYRLCVVLCYLQGKTNEEAAQLLGIPRGTVLSRLSRARERLRQRLTRRGVSIAGGAMAAMLAQTAAPAAVPAVLVESTLRAALHFTAGSAAGVALSGAAARAEGLLRAAATARLRRTAVLLVGLAVAGAGVGTLGYRVRTTASGEAAPVAALPTMSQALRPDKDRLQGTWRVTAGRQHGRPLDLLNGRQLVFTGDHFALDAGEAEIPGVVPSRGLEGQFVLELAGLRIDFLARRWNLRGIYALDSKTLTLCVAAGDDRVRPTNWDTAPGDERLLLVLRQD